MGAGVVSAALATPAESEVTVTAPWPAKLAAPRGYRITVRDVYPSAGAGFVVALAGDIMTMPGLSKSPSAERIRMLPDGTIEGLF